MFSVKLNSVSSSGSASFWMTTVPVSRLFSKVQVTVSPALRLMTAVPPLTSGGVSFDGSTQGRASRVQPASPVSLTA